MSNIKVGESFQAVCVVNPFTGSNERPAAEDKNGLMPVILRPLAGKAPNIGSVLSGTVAHNNNLEVGHRYFVIFTRQEDDSEYGVRFQILNGGEVTSLKEVLESTKELGKPEVVNVNAPVLTTAFTEN